MISPYGKRIDQYILICQDSLEGVFSAIYDAYADKYDAQITRIQTAEDDNYRLFATYVQMKPDQEKTKKVARTILREFGEETYTDICRALASEDADKADAVYHAICSGLKMKNKSELMGNLANDDVRHVFELSRYAGREIMHMNGFLRFPELEGGVLFSKIGPRNNIITFLAPHFSDRLPLENFVIYDEIRQLFIIHPARKQWTLVTGEYLDENRILKFSEREKEYQELFTFFCQKIAIKDRINYNLQRNMLPLHYREYMIEFNIS